MASSERGRLSYCADGVVFFFFQAEDGIRDLTVTGVQTCALPIFRGRLRSQDAEPAAQLEAERARRRGIGVGELDGAGGDAQVAFVLVHRELRSEERRVGKECRSRWSPYH